MEYDNTNRGSLFKNDRKDDAKFPDYKGSLNVDGTEYWLSAWIKVSKDGNQFMSLSIKPKAPAARQSSEPTRKSRDSGFDDMPDDLPF